MKVLSRLIPLCMVLVFSKLALTTAQVQAQEAAFDTTYNIEYAIDTSLVVSVKENIGIINQTSGAVPSAFIETITNITIYDVRAVDAKDRELQTTVESKNGQKETVINIPIENPAVGKDKKTQVTLYYKTKDLAEKTGRILNLRIPKAPVSSFVQEYNVQVKIPRDFGPQISITPPPIEEKMEETGYMLIYNKQSLEKYGISASFGDYQIFDFELEYNLHNNSLLTKSITATLPPIIPNYQEVSVLDITPKPISLKKDTDGNVLAVFKVAGKQTLGVKVTGKAKVYSSEAGAAIYGTDLSIPKELKKYTQQQLYWESQANELVSLAQKLTAKNASVAQNAAALYAYVLKTVEYDFDRAEQGKVADRKGGLQTLQDKKGLCQDFTDLFIALARSAGIPAREVSGYAYAKDLGATPTPQTKNLLHSWAQYYNPQQGWVSVDPTWGATSGLDYFSKLDNNHLAFAIRGVDSQNPQPAPKFTAQFATDDFFSKNSLYELENLPQEGTLILSPLLAGSIGAGLGLCTILFLLKVRSRRRYK